MLPGVPELLHDRKYKEADQLHRECKKYVCTQHVQPQVPLENWSSAGAPCAINSEQPVADHPSRSHLHVTRSALPSVHHRAPKDHHALLLVRTNTHATLLLFFSQVQVRLHSLADRQCTALLHLGVASFSLQSISQQFPVSNSLVICAGLLCKQRPLRVCKYPCTASYTAI